MASTATREVANKEEGAIAVRSAVDRVGAKVDRHKDNSAALKLRQDPEDMEQAARLLLARANPAAIMPRAIVHAVAADEVVVAAAAAASNRERRG
jgi:hypothetical protein